LPVVAVHPVIHAVPDTTWATCATPGRRMADAAKPGGRCRGTHTRMVLGSIGVTGVGVAGAAAGVAGGSAAPLDGDRDPSDVPPVSGRACAGRPDASGVARDRTTRMPRVAAPTTASDSASAAPDRIRL